MAVLSVGLAQFSEFVMHRKPARSEFSLPLFSRVYFITDSWMWGFAAAMSWLFLPWLEILTRIRALRLPKENSFGRKARRPRTLSQRSSEITREIEDEGFVHVGDAGWDWEDYRQFFRLFYREEDRAQAAICLNEQRDFSFYYLAHFIACQRRHRLDDVELSALLWLEADSAVPH